MRIFEQTIVAVFFAKNLLLYANIYVLMAVRGLRFLHLLRLCLNHSFYVVYFHLSCLHSCCMNI